MKPLVSIIVLSFNSSKTVIETLESAKRQTYRNIELIITDDGSKDKTVDICRNWLERNASFFVNSQIITSKENTGVSSNCNRGIRASKGEWIKQIAADDILLDFCIEKFVLHIEAYPNTEVIFSQMYTFKDTKEGRKIDFTPNLSLIKFFELTQKEKIHEELVYNKLPAPASFIHRKVLIQFPYNEIYRMMEDKPEWFTLLINGVKFDFINEATVLYRIGNSISNHAQRFTSIPYYQTQRLFFYNASMSYMLNHDIELYDYVKKEFLLDDIRMGLLRNKKNKWNYYMSLIIRKIIKITFDFKSI